MATLNVTFTGPSAANNSMTQYGVIYAGGAPDFQSVGATLNGSDYELTVYNFANFGGWPTVFKMTKNDGDPTNVLGSYSGGGGTAVVSD